MVEFCPECSNLLRKKNMGGKVYLICKCGYQREASVDKSKTEKEIEEKKKILDRNLVILKKEDQVSVNPIVKVTCPKCGNNEAEAWQRQIRSSDEPSTSFFRCTKCKHTWREN